MQRFAAIFFFGAVSLLPLTASAFDFQTVLGLGYDAGGDDLVRVTFVDGETSSVKANQGIAFALGAMLYNTGDFDWQTQATVGMKYKSIDSSNGDIKWTSYPIELIEFYNTDMIRFGLGVSYQINPEIKTTGVVAGHDVDLDDVLGYVAQLGFKTGKRGGFSVDFRYTTIKFSGEANRNGTRETLSDVSGDSAGIYVSAIF